jgi:hypothetical protein
MFHTPRPREAVGRSPDAAELIARARQLRDQSRRLIDELEERRQRLAETWEQHQGTSYELRLILQAARERRPQ